MCVHCLPTRCPMPTKRQGRDDAASVVANNYEKTLTASQAALFHDLMHKVNVAVDSCRYHAEAAYGIAEQMQQNVHDSKAHMGLVMMQLAKWRKEAEDS